MNKIEAIKKLNALGAAQEACFFIINYDCSKSYIFKLKDLDGSDILYDFNGKRNYELDTRTQEGSITQIKELKFENYYHSFDAVMSHIHFGNTYLCNLTFPIEIELNSNLINIFHQAQAKYKLLFKDQFLVFSPETFVQIANNSISAFPMKGTISAEQKDAKQEIIQDPKEEAEHATIVDLIRNDLSIVADKVRVENYRYVEKIKSMTSSFYQVSSKITGNLPENFKHELGDIIFSLLPAGSISGAPKQKTIEIINEAEGYNRGFYTGIAGIFDGKSLDSCVLIRFIEKEGNNFFFKTGGGVTSQSKVEKEYAELMEKVYVPVS